jgi:hypothetical protein
MVISLQIFNKWEKWEVLVENGSDWISLLSTNDLLALALCNSAMFALLSPIVS